MKQATNTVLNKYEVALEYCDSCGFLTYENPFWLEEAYGKAIASTDTGILSRNRTNVIRIGSFLRFAMRAAPDKTFLDIAGGYGIFVRGMRDAGFDFFWSDPYCENLLARGFEKFGENFAAVTAFEVLEHVTDPVEFLSEAATLCDHDSTIIFSTLLFDGQPPASDWWYYSFATGQHISFYQERTLRAIADKLELNLASLGGFHILSKPPLPPKWRLRLALSRLAPLLFRITARHVESKTQIDSYAQIAKLNQSS